VVGKIVENSDKIWKIKFMENSGEKGDKVCHEGLAQLLNW